MATAPYGVRLLVGAAVTAIEETRKLPQTILMYPMTFASQIAQLVMKVQQDVAVLVIKGDETLDTMFPPKDEQPEWATFDEDLPSDEQSGADIVTLPVRDGERLTEGRFALFSEEPETPNTTAAGAADAATATSDAPEIVTEIDYQNLTLAQLRARLTSLRIPDLEALLAYEETTKARAPFQTLLANRITRASAK
ncbi:lipid droplet-associated protein [Mycolicibacterium sp. 018/SC-01/001]|uniref:lipid droplet-associated protein n=1 Tax=Mycolicibacterium sp. 018/SC-01/001 TaxID=2592069 RepID=UPI00117E1F0E|nr:lipid droplet-associated protein [Mycolicibacterium sp. 018/SC-01/001]TRW78726.1 lipid droplet-associated protein [Mycolicibacterium sp. 018/SC-01/001]